MENENRDIAVKCKVKVIKQLFPKGDIEAGTWGMVLADVLQVMEGDVKFNKSGYIKLVGTMPDINYENEYVVTAKEETHEKFGFQYKIMRMGLGIDLSSPENGRVFLSKILTENQVEALYEALNDPIEALENEDIKALCSAKGVGEKIVLRLIENYNMNKDNSRAFIELDSYDLSKNTINKLCDKYGNADIVVAKIKKNPYILIEEVAGYGWNKADEIALAGGLGEHSHTRVTAYIKYFLGQCANNGDSWIYGDDLFDGIDADIGYDLPPDITVDCIQQLEKEGLLWINQDRTIIGLKKYYDLEEKIAKELKRLNEGVMAFNFDGWIDRVKLQEEYQGFKFGDEQLLGIQSSLQHLVNVLVSGAGCGKSTLVAGLLKALNTDNFAQCCLSGKASSNLQEITEKESYTIHRLLKIDPETGRFVYNKDTPMPYDIIILDETGMVSADLFYNLISAIKTGAMLILIGDPYQLPSIGIGNIFKDIIESDYLNIIELTEIHRQGKDSGIIVTSKEIREGTLELEKEPNRLITGKLQDFILDTYRGGTGSTTGFDKVMEQVRLWIDEVPNSEWNMQVITPVKERGNCSAYKFNIAIQEEYKKRELARDKKDDENKVCKFQEDYKINLAKDGKYPYTIYQGDKVINVKNNYKCINMNGLESPVFNGDIGIVKVIESKEMIIDFKIAGRLIIPREHLSFIQLGYAITVHKSQGSTIPYVIGVLDSSHFTMANRGLLYTLITRAKKGCALFGDIKMLQRGVENNETDDKQTFLGVFLTKYKEEKRIIFKMPNSDSIAITEEMRLHIDKIKNI